jgi:hypothetical protein
MKKPGNGDDDKRLEDKRLEQAGGGAPRYPGETSVTYWRTAEGALFISSTLVTLCFLIHIFILFLVEPLRVLALPKESAYAYSAIPLYFGVLFLLSSIYNFTKIESRSAVHFLALIVAFIFGSLSLQGVAGFIMFVVRQSSEI